MGLGAASGAVAGLVGWAVPAGFAALGMKAATAGGAAFIGGITGALAAGAGRITANLLTPCMKWYTGVSSAMFWGALGGALLGWAGWHVRQWWVSSRTSQLQNDYIRAIPEDQIGTSQPFKLRPGEDGLSVFEGVLPEEVLLELPGKRIPNTTVTIPRDGLPPGTRVIPTPAPGLSTRLSNAHRIIIAPEGVSGKSFARMLKILVGWGE